MPKPLKRAVTAEQALSRILKFSAMEPSQHDYDLVRRYLYKVFLRHLPSAGYDPNDFLQDAICKALLARHTWRGDASLKSWFSSIARNMLLDWVRERARTQGRFHLGAAADEQLDDMAEEEIAEPEHSGATLEELRRGLHAQGKPKVTQFFETLLDWFRQERGRDRMQFIMREMCMTRRSQYNSLTQQLKRALGNCKPLPGAANDEEDDPT